MNTHLLTWSPVLGSSSGVSISACLKNTLPRQARHRRRSNEGTRSRAITPVTNLNAKKMKIKRHYNYEYKKEMKQPFQRKLFFFPGIDQVICGQHEACYASVNLRSEIIGSTDPRGACLF